ncbi:MAG: MoaD/ThiS family protein [Bacillota bacterium]
MIRVEFLGVLRLKYGLASQDISVQDRVTIRGLIELIAAGRGNELKADLLRQSYHILSPDGEERLHRLPGALGAVVCDGSRVIVVTPLTGG